MIYTGLIKAMVMAVAPACARDGGVKSNLTGIRALLADGVLLEKQPESIAINRKREITFFI